MSSYLTKLFSLEGQTAMVTGATRGIGQAMTLALAEAGADIISIQRDTSNTTTHDRIVALGRKCTIYDADLSSSSSLESLVPRVLADGHHISILLCAHGIQVRHDAEKFPTPDLEAVLQTNLSSVFVLNRDVGAHMLASQPLEAATSSEQTSVEHASGRRGAIINMASLMSYQGGIRVPAYAASKGGIASMTKAFSNEWAGKGVTVNAIAPGYIATDMISALMQDQERSKSILERIPANRWGRPEDFAGAVVYLASGASKYVTGGPGGPGFTQYRALVSESEDGVHKTRTIKSDLVFFFREYRDASTSKDERESCWKNACTRILKEKAPRKMASLDLGARSLTGDFHADAKILTAIWKSSSDGTWALEELTKLIEGQIGRDGRKNGHIYVLLCSNTRVEEKDLVKVKNDIQTCWPKLATHFTVDSIRQLRTEVTEARLILRQHQVMPFLVHYKSEYIGRANQQQIAVTQMLEDVALAEGAREEDESRLSETDGIGAKEVLSVVIEGLHIIHKKVTEGQFDRLKDDSTFAEDLDGIFQRYAKTPDLESSTLTMTEALKAMSMELVAGDIVAARMIAGFGRVLEDWRDIITSEQRMDVD